MNLTSVWKNRRTGKKKSVRKPKIRWQLLGLTDPDSVDNTSSIEAIRREVTSLARYSFGPDTRLRATAQESKSLGKNHEPVEARNKRRGAAGQIPARKPRRLLNAE
ncbi:MAG TPA: hypothetical protein VN666_10850 [Nitrospira sp.]|nr:hypothetical protein [Nitrospira sp.]